MAKTVIKIENLSKIYRLGEVGTGTLSHDLNRWFRMNILGQDDPYAMIGHVNDRTKKAQKSELVAALRDIDLEIKEGDILGIIGKNGAGKSTLLKILSRVTAPTTGSIKIKGHMASLLEVGTGFHPEMTGRENIFMNGTIMGMRKWEVSRKLDEIVEFAGVAKYLDTPVKRYSSGMMVRLGFAVAAHLEPEILIVDEVLAVGDAEFQRKAVGKMKDVSSQQGRTVLFVSHNMGSIQNLCTSGIILQNGLKSFSSNNIQSVIHEYQTNHYAINTDLTDFKPREGIGDFIFTHISILNQNKQNTNIFRTGDTITFKLGVKNIHNELSKLQLVVGIRKSDDTPVAMLANEYFDTEMISDQPEQFFYCKLRNTPLTSGRYIINLMIKKSTIESDWLKDVTYFDIEGGHYIHKDYSYPNNYKGIYLDHEWNNKF